MLKAVRDMSLLQALAATAGKLPRPHGLADAFVLSTKLPRAVEVHEDRKLSGRSALAGTQPDPALA
jgi:hypothetical protein